MAENENEKSVTDQSGNLDRRSVLAGGAATVATVAIPGVASARKKDPGGELSTRGAVYMDPRYLDRFNTHAYSAQNIGAVHTLIKNKFPIRSNLKWGLYQQLVEPVKSDWGSTAAFDNWPDFSQDARDDLEKLPAKFTDPKNAMNPFDTTQVAANLVEHLDEVIRIALWDFSVPIKIKVEKNPKRHHGLTTEWEPAPQAGANPNLQLTGLKINVDCPDGGWQGFTLWRNKSSTEHITKFVAKWTVPLAPTTQDGQIIFIFNGLESVSGPNTTGGILQPVLQWTNDGWLIRSWYLTADFDPQKYPQLPDAGKKVDQDHLGDENRCYSEGVRVNPGDKLIGIIEGGRTATGKFNYSSILSLNGSLEQKTKLPLVDIPELTYAVCAVESYKVKRPVRTRYPSGTIALTSVDLQVDNRSLASINWKKSKKAGRDYTADSNAAGSRVEFDLA